jgi:hypothetical protein
MKKTFLALTLALSVVATGASAQGFRFEGPGGGGFSFRFGPDDRRGDVEGKRASCEVYAQLAQVQAQANRRYRCGYYGGRWDENPEPHFRWCRFVRRESLAFELRERAVDLQRCFDRLGDFDDDSWDRRR